MKPKPHSVRSALAASRCIAARTLRPLPALSRGIVMSGAAVLALTQAAAAQGGGGEGGERILWSFQTADSTFVQFLARAADGTIYTADADFTYALSPQGTLLWTTPAASGDDHGARPIEIGADGTIYTGVGINDVAEPSKLVIALNPDGSVRWEFEAPTNNDLAVGPSIGPDGNIYGVQEGVAFGGGGIGVFALSPAGQLLWTSPGEPPLQFSGILSNSPIAFTDTTLHFGIVFLASGGQPHTMTFDLVGNQLWSGTQPASRIFPQVDPFDRVIVSFGQTGLRAITPLNQEIWTTLHPTGASQVIRPAIGASGTLYSGDSLGVDLWALNPDGTTRWVRPSMPGMSLRALGVSPDESVIVAYGSGPNTTGRIWGFDAADGSLIWDITLQDENGSTQLVSSYEPIFTPDSQTAYVTTDFSGALPEHGYVYSLRIQPGAACYPNCDNSTQAPILNIADFSCFLTRFAQQDPYANCDNSTQSPVLNVADFSCFLTKFAAGCR